MNGLCTKVLLSKPLITMIALALKVTIKIPSDSPHDSSNTSSRWQGGKESHLKLRRQEERLNQMNEAVNHLQEILARTDEQEKELVELVETLSTPSLVYNCVCSFLCLSVHPISKRDIIEQNKARRVLFSEYVCALTINVSV